MLPGKTPDKYLMLKHVAVFCLCVLLTGTFFTAYAQNDSLVFANTKWRTKHIEKGIVLKEFWFHNSLFNSNQNISILEIKRNTKAVLELGYKRTLLQKTSVFAGKARAIAAINGSFFDIRNGGSVVYLRSNDSVINENRLNIGGKRLFYQKSALIFNKKRVAIEGWDGTEKWEGKLVGDVILTGPLLVADSKPVYIDTTAFNRIRNPRSAIAATKNRILLITVDGRNANAAGMSMYELQHLMQWLHSRDGTNLDGGGSTTLWVNSQPGNGVVNHPSDNKKLENTVEFKSGVDPDTLPPDFEKWDHEGERKVANVILVKKRKHHRK